MKYYVLAALLGVAAAAPEDCDDASTGMAKDLKAAADTLKIKLAAQLVVAEALVVTQTENHTKVRIDSDIAAGVALPFKNAFATATLAHKTQADAVAAADKAIADNSVKLGEVLGFKTADALVVGATQALIDTLNDEILVQTNNVEQHEAEKVLLDLALKVKTDNTADVKALDTTKDEEIAASVVLIGGAGSGLIKATADANSANIAKDNSALVTTEGNTFTTMQTANVQYQQSIQKVAQLQKVCTDKGTGNACVAGDQVFELKASAVLLDTALKNTYDAAVLLWAVQRDLLSVAKREKATLTDTWEAAKIAQAAEESVKSGLEAAKGIPPAAGTAQNLVLEKAKESADQTAANDVATQTINAKAELALVKLRLVDVNAKKKKDDDKLLISTHMWKIEDDKKVAETALKAAANANISDLNALVAQSKAIDDRAQLRVAFYMSFTDVAKTALDAAAQQVTDTKAAQVTCDADIASYTTAQVLAIQQCKGRGYATAQAAMAAWESQKKTDKDAYDALKSEYDVETAAKGAGKAGSRCEYPAAKADGTQDPRPVCDEKLCCGSANRFEKNGTKLTVETCQLAEGTTTYTYMPPLPAGALVRPRTETWRFACISGAQQLAATATAALAAVYMMN